ALPIYRDPGGVADRRARRAWRRRDRGAAARAAGGGAGVPGGAHGARVARPDGAVRRGPGTLHHQRVARDRGVRDRRRVVARVRGWFGWKCSVSAATRILATAF